MPFRSVAAAPGMMPKRESVKRLLEEFRRFPDSDQRAFLERLDGEGWYQIMVRHLQSEWDNPQDDAYNNL